MPVKGYRKILIFTFIFAFSSVIADTQIRDWPDDEREGIKINYTEAKVPDYTLQDPLTLQNGKKVTDVQTWNEQRRPEIMRLFEENQFGRAVGDPRDVSFEVFDKGTSVFEGKALRRQVTMHFRRKLQVDLLIYLPANAKGPSPLLLNIGFMANSQTVDDPGIGRDTGSDGKKQQDPAGKGFSFPKANVMQFIERGYGYQFCANYAKWGDDPNSAPMDAHMLIALMAPRPVLLQTGDTDKWSDPMGEFLAAVAAEPVYKLFSKKGFGTDQIQESGTPILNDIGYYMHKGGHGMNAEDGTSDWNVYLDFMDRHLKPQYGNKPHE